MSATTDLIDLKLATRQTCDAAKATLAAVATLMDELPGLHAQILPSLQAASDSLAAADAADTMAFEQLNAIPGFHPDFVAEQERKSR